MNATKEKPPKNISHLNLSQIEEKGLTHLLKVKKVYKRDGSKPRYVLDKRSQFSLTYWFNLLMKEYVKLRPAQRSRIALDCWKVLIGKANNLPADPEESKFNATETMNVLKEMEIQGNAIRNSGDLKLDEKGREVKQTIESGQESVGPRELEYAMVRPNPPTVKPLPTKKLEMPLPCPTDAPQTDESPSI